VPIEKFSTDDVRRPERFDYWDDLLSARFFDMTVTPPLAHRADFEGYAVLRLNRSAVLMELKSTTVDFERAQSNIRRAPSGTFILYQQISGGITLNAFQQAAFSIVPGAMMLGSADHPFRASPLVGQNSNFRILALPEQALNQITGTNRPMALQPLDPAAGIFALLSSYYNALWREVDRLTAMEEAIAFDTLAQLVAVARGSLAPEHELTRGGMREALRHAAREYIEANLHSTDLSPSAAAAVLRISVRQLHLLFETMDKSFSRYVQARRLERARIMLLRRPWRPIIQIAFACGFESLTTFNRGFRATFSLSPTELRQQAVDPDE
jgi:AraC-like DNA-binding protein